MSFTIKVIKSETKQVEKEIYLPKEEREPDGPQYATELVEENVDSVVYSQTVDTLDLKSVINAVNSQTQPPIDGGNA